MMDIDLYRGIPTGLSQHSWLQCIYWKEVLVSAKQMKLMSRHPESPMWLKLNTYLLTPQTNKRYPYIRGEESDKCSYFHCLRFVTLMGSNSFCFLHVQIRVHRKCFNIALVTVVCSDSKKQWLINTESNDGYGRAADNHVIFSCINIFFSLVGPSFPISLLTRGLSQSK